MPCPTQDMFFMISRYKLKYFPIIYNSPQFVENEKGYIDKNNNTQLINYYLKSQNNSLFKYTINEIIESESNQVVSHLFTTKPYLCNANKKNGKIWLEYAKLANAYDKLKDRYPKAFELYES